MPNYDVVTVSFQNATTIKRYLDSRHADLQQLTVVDNGSHDGTVEQLQALLKSQQLLLNQGNLGYATAANQGAAVGCQPYIAFINPDCFIDNAGLQHLVDYLNQHPKTGIVGCRVLNDDGQLQAASCRRLPTFWRVFNHLTGFYRLGLPGINKAERTSRKSTSVEAINGALFVIRRDLFEQLDGYDESYPLHFEDLDLFTRCLKSGYEIYYLATQEAIHLQGQSRQENKLIKQWKRTGIKRYFKKHRPAWESWVVSRLLVR